MQSLGSWGGGSYASAINNNGQVVGWADTNGASEPHAFIYDGVTKHDLCTLGGTESFASSINDSGQIVGKSTLVGDSSFEAFLYGDDGQMRGLGTLGGADSLASDINNNGQIVGGSKRTDGTSTVFIYDIATETMTDLFSLIDPQANWAFREAHAINDLGQIVGWGYHYGHYRAFLANPVPEPTTLSLFAFGGLALLHRRTRR